jgi:hypothetical protein
LLSLVVVVDRASLEAIVAETMRDEYGWASSVTGQAIADGLQAMVNGGSSVQNFLVRKTNTDYNNVSVSGSVDVDFDLTY